MSTEEFIERTKTIHNDKYDYSKVVYVNGKTKVCVICPTHGEFWIRPDKHLSGQGCPKCSGRARKTTEEFKEEVSKIHGEKYDTSKVVYVNNKTKVCLICPIHGEFWITPHNCLMGQGCPKCGGSEKRTLESFINDSNVVHNFKYDYSKTEYNGIHEKVCIICHEKDENGEEHGEFWQAPNEHLHGQGCPKCRSKRIWESRGRITIDEIKEKLNSIFCGQYDYSLFTKYENSRMKIPIICKKHGVFIQSLDNHLQGHGCPKCACVESKAENEIYKYVCGLIGDENVIKKDREILDGKELDIYIPCMRIAIEYNGLRWHSEEFNKGNDYHLNKLLQCNSKGIKLIQIFEDEWLERKDIVLKKIKHILGFNDGEKIYARNTSIREIDCYEARDFLEKNHIQGFVASTKYFGAFYKDSLIAVMTFTLEGDRCWNLTRFATDNDKRCIGLAGKLFSAFLRAYNPKYVKSFADRRWTLSEANNVYVRLGFELEEEMKPQYRYVNGHKREHKFKYRKKNLHKRYGVPIEWTEHKMTKHLGFYRIYDCGLLKYGWKNKKEE